MIDRAGRELFWLLGGRRKVRAERLHILSLDNVHISHNPDVLLHVVREF